MIEVWHKSRADDAAWASEMAAQHGLGRRQWRSSMREGRIEPMAVRHESRDKLGLAWAGDMSLQHWMRKCWWRSTGRDDTGGIAPSGRVGVSRWRRPVEAWQEEEENRRSTMCGAHLYWFREWEKIRREKKRKKK